MLDPDWVQPSACSEQDVGHFLLFLAQDVLSMVGYTGGQDANKTGTGSSGQVSFLQPSRHPALL